MTGEGADELFGGYLNTLHAEDLTGFLPWRQRVLRSAEPALLGDPLRVPERALRKLWGVAVRIASRSPPPPQWTSFSLPRTDHDPVSESIDAYAHHAGQRQVLEAGLLSRLDFTLCWLLNRMDKNIMEASVEARVPFLEPDVVRLALNLPLEARVGPWSKGILRDVARRVLPWSIAHRPKIYGMAFDAAAWISPAANPGFLADGLLREQLRIPREQFTGLMTEAGGAPSLRLWSAEVWCRSVLAGHSIAQIERDLWR